jgi:hypothetical protein
MNNPFDDAVLSAIASGSGVENPTTPPSLNRRVLSLATFPSPNVSPTTTSHTPAPPSSILLDDLSKPRAFLDPRSNADPVDPYDASLWWPGSPLSVPIRARDGEFERFIRDENGRLGYQDPTSCPALLMRLKRDVNRTKSCCTARAIGISARYASRPLLDLVDFRNDVAILRSNSNYSRRDVVGTLSGLTYLDAHLPESDIETIRQSHTAVTAVSESILAMEGLVTRLDAIIAHSCDEYQRTCRKSGISLDEDSAPVILLDDEGEEVGGEAEVVGGRVADKVEEGGGMVGKAVDAKRTTLPTYVANDDVIDISDDE